jgi:hypothetical protein
MSVVSKALDYARVAYAVSAMLAGTVRECMDGKTIHEGMDACVPALNRRLPGGIKVNLGQIGSATLITCTAPGGHVAFRYVQNTNRVLVR